MKKLASILMAALLVTMLAVTALAAPGDDVPSVGREDAVTVVGEENLPDANAPDAPDFVIVQDPDDPDETENFVKVDDPNAQDPDESESVYVNENDVPLDNPDTTAADKKADDKKDESAGVHKHMADVTCWVILIVSALIGLILGFVIGRATKKNDDKEGKKDDENAKA